MTVDAVVIGAGPNGLVAANDLADHGWDVLVVEAQPHPGGAVRSGETTESGFVTDRFSAFYPLGIVSPHFARLQLECYGLDWSHAPAVLAHPTLDGPAALLSRTIELTAASLEQFRRGDGDQWVALQSRWDAIEHDVVGALMGPFPPLRAGLGLFGGLGPHGVADLARLALLPVRRFAEEQFGGDGAALLLAGSALHSDLTPDAAISGFFGWLMTAIGQHHGWPVPRTGSSTLIAALVTRLGRAGGQIRCNAKVDRVEVSGGRAVAVQLAGGERISVRAAVLADVAVPQLYGDLIDDDALTPRFREDLKHYQPGSATFKVNWTLSNKIPWTDPAVADAGTVHLASSLDELTMAATEITMGYLPRNPFVLLGQMTTADPTRSPAGTESVWAYTNVPQRIRGDRCDEIATLTHPADIERFADRLEQRVEQFAPGFRDRIRYRDIQPPASFQLEDANLVGGDKSLGTAALHQQLVFRPTIGLGRAGTPIRGLFLASASAHPGGGVHGACGANAARATIAADRRRIGRIKPTRSKAETTR